MSKQFQRIAIETDAWCDQNFFGNMNYNRFWEQKFAELIVLECCQKLENDGMVEVAMEMKQHFGVEE